MPKIKTNRAAAKRFNKTGTGKIKHKVRGLRHGLEKQSKDRKRNNRQTGYISERDHDNVARMIPYK